jgi:polar amino acid transport system substrate-binding protein
MVIGIILIAAFTADITVTNTVEQLQGNIQGASDLPGNQIATVSGTTAADYLNDNNLIFTPVATIEEAYALLDSGDVDAVVFDAPVLLYYAATEGNGKVQVVGSLFERQDYGIALPSASPLREDIDRALLAVLEEGTYDEIYQRWFAGR